MRFLSLFSLLQSYPQFLHSVVICLWSRLEHLSVFTGAQCRVVTQTGFLFIISSSASISTWRRTRPPTFSSQYLIDSAELCGTGTRAVIEQNHQKWRQPTKSKANWSSATNTRWWVKQQCSTEQNVSFFLRRVPGNRALKCYSPKLVDLDALNGSSILVYLFQLYNVYNFCLLVPCRTRKLCRCLSTVKKKTNS